MRRNAPKLGVVSTAAPPATHSWPAQDYSQPSVPGKLSSKNLRLLLSQIVAENHILDRAIDRIGFASDASFYRMIPQVVVLAQSIEEIVSLFHFSRYHHVPLTFRAAGTSLSGQSLSDGILVEAARYWRHLQVEDGGERVRVQPGVIGSHVNTALRPYGRKIGPDPASLNSCMVGGILSNNSSGKCCGVAQNAYHTLDSLTFVLPSGTVIDTATPAANQIFYEREPGLARELSAIRQEIESSPALYQRIRKKYRTKNTTGYSLNAFLDFETPVDIFQHLLIGSEGTLAFIAEAVLKTVPDLPVKYTGLLLFQDLHQAAACIVPLRDAGAAALEIMDRASLRSVENQAGVPPTIQHLPESAAGMLVEFQGLDLADCEVFEHKAHDAIAKMNPIVPPFFTRQHEQQAALWKMRAGMFPSIGAMRKRGTAVIIEDVAFPIGRIAEAIEDLQRLFKKHGYGDAIIFGHAKDGNLHYVITQSFADASAVNQYARFIDDVVRMVVEKYDGALKAEHGTGRNMAPFVEKEWGEQAYAIMRRLKQSVDPDNILNPGVVVNSDPQAHISNLKQMPLVDNIVDRCIECGYCESKCPSRDLTLTPRQRIVVARETRRLQETNSNPRLLAELEQDFLYSVEETCAVDGLCAMACPVAIDTGQLIKLFRKSRHSPSSHRFANLLARNFRSVECSARAALSAGHVIQSIFGTAVMSQLTSLFRVLIGDQIPRWIADIPKPARRIPTTSLVESEAVYFPACISRVLGESDGFPSTSSTISFLRVAERAGVRVHIPRDIRGVCCGVPFSSKGFDHAFHISANRTIQQFWEWSQNGKLPVVVDSSPCSYALLQCRPHLSPVNQRKFDQLTILDSIAYVHDHLLSKLKVRQRVRSIAIHPVCSAIKLGLTSKLMEIAHACGEKVDIPTSAGCCGFAGDRGFLVPELTKSATWNEAIEIRTRRYDAYWSSSRTCEIGLSRAVGRPYRSYIHLLEWATRQAKPPVNTC